MMSIAIDRSLIESNLTRKEKRQSVSVLSLSTTHEACSGHFSTKADPLKLRRLAADDMCHLSDEWLTT